MKTLRFATLAIVTFVSFGSLVLSLTGCGQARAADQPWLAYPTVTNTAKQRFTI